MAPPNGLGPKQQLSVLASLGRIILIAMIAYVVVPWVVDMWASPSAIANNPGQAALRLNVKAQKDAIMANLPNLQDALNLGNSIATAGTWIGNNWEGVLVFIIAAVLIVTLLRSLNKGGLGSVVDDLQTSLSNRFGTVNGILQMLIAVVVLIMAWVLYQNRTELLPLLASEGSGLFLVVMALIIVLVASLGRIAAWAGGLVAGLVRLAVGILIALIGGGVLFPTAITSIVSAVKPSAGIVTANLIADMPDVPFLFRIIGAIGLALFGLVSSKVLSGSK